MKTKRIYVSIGIQLDDDRTIELPVAFEVYGDRHAKMTLPDEFKELTPNPAYKGKPTPMERDPITRRYVLLNLDEMYLDFDKIIEKLWQKYRNVKVIR
jgi:hypothetical protein